MSDQLQRAAEHAVQGGVMVPVGYAEKSMASLMQLHTELMDEKERRVDLYRRLMDKEQALAELKMYVRLLEEKIAKPSEESRGTKAPANRVGPASTPNGKGASFQARPPAPPRPISRGRPRLSLKPTAPAPRSAPPAANGAGLDAARPDRPGTDGWRAW
jgi:hypothetical protein